MFTYHIYDWNRARRDVSYAGEYITRQQAAQLALSENLEEREQALKQLEDMAVNHGYARTNTLEGITLTVRAKQEKS
jgi:hypothetical protein